MAWIDESSSQCCAGYGYNSETHAKCTKCSNGYYKPNVGNEPCANCDADNNGRDVVTLTDGAAPGTGATDASQCYALCPTNGFDPTAVGSTSYTNVASCTPPNDGTHQPRRPSLAPGLNGNAALGTLPNYELCECDRNPSTITCDNNTLPNPAMDTDTADNQLCVSEIGCLSLFNKTAAPGNGNRTKLSHACNCFSNCSNACKAKVDNGTWNFDQCAFKATENSTDESHGKITTIYEYIYDNTNFTGEWRGNDFSIECDSGYVKTTEIDNECKTDKTKCKCTRAANGYYADNGEQKPCPMGTTSEAGASSIESCYLKKGTLTTATDGTVNCGGGTIFRDSHGVFCLPADIQIHVKKTQ